jgi:hypothetical protein
MVMAGCYLPCGRVQRDAVGSTLTLGVRAHPRWSRPYWQAAADGAVVLVPSGRGCLWRSGLTSTNRT